MTTQVIQNPIGADGMCQCGAGPITGRGKRGHLSSNAHKAWANVNLEVTPTLPVDGDEGEDAEIAALKARIAELEGVEVGRDWSGVMDSDLEMAVEIGKRNRTRKDLQQAATMVRHGFAARGYPEIAMPGTVRDFLVDHGVKILAPPREAPALEEIGASVPV